MCGVGLKHKSDYRRWAVLFNNTSPELNSDPTVETWIQNPLAMTKLYSDYQVILSDFFKSLTKTKHDDGITSTSPSMRTICFILTLMACNTSDYKYWALSKMICCTLYQFPIDYNSLTQSKWDESILSIVFSILWQNHWDRAANATCKAKQIKPRESITSNLHVPINTTWSYKIYRIQPYR